MKRCRQQDGYGNCKAGYKDCHYSKCVDFQDTNDETITELIHKTLCKNLKKYDTATAEERKNMTGTLYKILNLIYNEWEYITKGL